MMISRLANSEKPQHTQAYVRILRRSVTQKAHCYTDFSTFSKYVSGLFGSNASFAHITVTKSSVSERFIML